MPVNHSHDHFSAAPVPTLDEGILLMCLLLTTGRPPQTYAACSTQDVFGTRAVPKRVRSRRPPTGPSEPPGTLCVPNRPWTCIAPPWKSDDAQPQPAIVFYSCPSSCFPAHLRRTVRHGHNFSLKARNIEGHLPWTSEPGDDKGTSRFCLAPISWPLGQRESC